MQCARDELQDITQSAGMTQIKDSQCKDNFDFSMYLHKPRGTLARTIYNKQLSDTYMAKFDKSQWYNCDLSRIPPPLAAKFIQLDHDKDTMKFIEQSEEKSNWIFLQIWHVIVRCVLSWFMTQTSINGWLRRGSMFVVSSSQFLKLLKSDGDWHRDTIIDLGAGDGGVTAHIAPFFSKVYATEVSNTMRNLLRSRGYNVLEVETWDMDGKYDMIACLNLLDRCNTPLQLLKQIRQALNPDGLLFLALVLPFSAYVEIGSENHKPEELLPIVGKTFEEQIASVVKDVFQPSGFSVESWSRVPYLCEGDLRQSYYWLDDAVFILRVSDENISN
ncbi:protein-L-histidine N-pros-methyltransferase [Coccinella septempunctata]|uniref:protein-L-histidine N-pros-methyltransferase n=1 Tax=Coccinella septempunctata TaxID=41139 RepID=UPI001D07692A|nr:protein-L-histidine N-pros-methyltransferase [Coccinella septempunctata]